MNHISFQPERWNGTHLSISVGTDGSEEKLNFVFDEVIPLEEDSLAIALSTLCGTRFDRIDFGFPVSSSVVSGIAEWTGSDVQASGSLDFIPNKKDGSNAVLNFSGGSTLWPQSSCWETVSSSLWILGGGSPENGISFSNSTQGSLKQIL